MKNDKIKVVTYLRVASNNDKELANKENEMMKLIDKHAFRNTKLASVVFEDVNGWKAGSTSLAAADLSDTAIAAKYLGNTYRGQTWKKG